MANGDLLDEVDVLLSKRQISNTAATRLMIRLQKKALEKLDALGAKQADHETRITAVENISVVRFTQKHPKTTAGLLAGFLALAAAIPTEKLWEAAKKWLGF